MEEAGIVYPKGDGASAGEWTCSKCGDAIQDAWFKEMVLLESELRETEVGMIKFNDLVNLRMLFSGSC
jgi:hypothetical protein